MIYEIWSTRKNEVEGSTSHTLDEVKKAGLVMWMKASCVVGVIAQYRRAYVHCSHWLVCRSGRMKDFASSDQGDHYSRELRRQARKYPA